MSKIFAFYPSSCTGRRRKAPWFACCVCACCVLCLATAAAATAAAAPLHEGLAGWHTAGRVSSEAAITLVSDWYQWDVTPAGDRMAALSPVDGDAVSWQTTADALALPPPARAWFGTRFGDGPAGITATGFAWIYTDLALDAGASWQMAWNHLSADTHPANDASFASWVCLDDPYAAGRIDGREAHLALLAAIQPATACYATGEMGATGWQTITFQAGRAGRYRLGFAVFNDFDHRRDPWLLLGDAPGSTWCDGEAYASLSPDPHAPWQPALPPPTPTPAAATTVGTTATFSRPAAATPPATAVPAQTTWSVPTNSGAPTAPPVPTHALPATGERADRAASYAWTIVILVAGGSVWLLWSAKTNGVRCDSRTRSNARRRRDGL